jgi:hypothetical protein
MMRSALNQTGFLGAELFEDIAVGPAEVLTCPDRPITPLLGETVDFLSALLPGYDADITLFDLDGLKFIGDPIEPRRYPEGIEHVFVNGTAVVEKGEHTGAKLGKIVKRAA